MYNFKFHIKDRQHDKEREEIAEALNALGGKRIKTPESADLLIVHRNTDSPGKTGGIPESAVRECIERRGIYIEYTTGNSAWERASSPTEMYYGSHIGLLERLATLEKPTSLDNMRPALDQGLHVVYLSALSILCQGYLAVHAKRQGNEWGPPEIKSALCRMGWPAFIESGEGREWLKADLAGKRGAVTDPAWWSKVFEGDKSRVKSEIARDLGVDKVDNSKDGAIFQNLIDAIYKTESIELNLIATAYCTIADRLQGQRVR